MATSSDKNHYNASLSHSLRTLLECLPFLASLTPMGLLEAVNHPLGVHVFLGYPLIVLRRPACPLHQVVDLALDHLLVPDLFEFVLFGVVFKLGERELIIAIPWVVRFEQLKRDHIMESGVFLWKCKSVRLCPNHFRHSERPN